MTAGQRGAARGAVRLVQMFVYPAHPRRVLNGSWGHFMARAQERKNVRESVKWAATKAMVDGQLQAMQSPVSVTLVWVYRNVPPKVDADGLMARSKPILDGLVDAGLIEDDSLAHIGTPTVVVEKGARNEIEIRLVERGERRLA